MTQSRGKPKPKGDVRPETLKQFSADLDAHAGRVVGFERMVTDLARTRAAVKQMKAARAAVHAHVKRAYEIGHRVISGTGLELRQTQPGYPVTYLAVDSAAAKKADKAAWARAQARERWVQITPPSSFVLRLRLPELPEARDFIPPAEAVVLYAEHPAWDYLKALMDDEKALINKLDKLAADFGWDGGETDGPLVFADGWTAQLARRVYSSERLAEIDPALFKALAVTKVKQAAVRVYVAQADGGGEHDEYDGD